MADNNNGTLAAPFDKIAVEVVAGGGVKMGVGLVEQQQVRPGDKGPGQQRALPLPAAETVYGTAGQSGKSESREGIGRLTAVKGFHHGLRQCRPESTTWDTVTGKLRSMSRRWGR